MVFIRSLFKFELDNPLLNSIGSKEAVPPMHTQNKCSNDIHAYKVRSLS